MLLICTVKDSPSKTVQWSGLMAVLRQDGTQVASHMSVVNAAPTASIGPLSASYHAWSSSQPQRITVFTLFADRGIGVNNLRKVVAYYCSSWSTWNRTRHLRIASSTFIVFFVIVHNFKAIEISSFFNSSFQNTYQTEHFRERQCKTVKKTIVAKTDMSCFWYIAGYVKTDQFFKLTTPVYDHIERRRRYNVVYNSPVLRGVRASIIYCNHVET